MDWIKVDGGFEDEDGNFISDSEAEALEAKMLDSQEY